MAGSNWAHHRLADLCESIDYGYTASAAESPVGPKFLRITDIVTGHLNWRDVPYCHIPTEAIPRYQLHHGDVVIARTGATTGFSAYVSNPPHAVFASYLVRLKLGDKVNPRFIAYFLKTPDFWNYIRGVLGDKSAQPNASAKTITQVKLRLPPLPQQRTIAHILGALDDKIELNRKMNETLEAMARAIFKSYFVDFDPVRAKMEGRNPPGMDADTADLFPDSFQDSPMGKIPKGWNTALMGSICEIAIGGDWGQEEEFEGSTKVVCLRGCDMERLRIGGFADAPCRWLKTSSIRKRQMTTKDVLIAASGAGPSGRPLWVSPSLLNHVYEIPATYSNFVKRLTTKSVADAVYLDRVLFDMHSDDSIWDYINGTSVPNLDGKGLLSGCRILVPPVQVLEAFLEILIPIYEKLYNQENHSLAAIRDALLPKLLSGEIRVKDTATNIPERIT